MTIAEPEKRTEIPGRNWPWPRIRPAEMSEADAIMAMCRIMFDENGIGAAMDEGMVRAEIEEGLKRTRGGIFVIGDDGRIEGSIYLIFGHLWYANVWWLEDRWNFVLPEYRRSDNSKQLINFAKWMACEQFGIPLMMSILNNHRTEAKVRLYQRILGKPSGAFFLYGATTGHSDVQRV